MDPQAPPPAAATYAHHPQHHPQYAHPDASHQHEPDFAYNEKDAYYASAQYTQPQQPQYYQQAQPVRHQQRGSKGSNRRGHDSVISPPFSPQASSPPSPSSSVSSGGHRRETHQIQQAAPANVAYPVPARLDAEKGSPGSWEREANVTTAFYDASMYNGQGPEDKPVQLLLFLSGPCVILSFVIALWSFFCIILALVLAPFRPLSQQLINFLAPALNLQLRLIYSYAASDIYSVPMLVTIHLFSPIVSLGVAIAAWTAACFWFFNAILGDPAGQDQGKHNDGKDTLLAVRNWWDRWLTRGLRVE